MPCPEIEFTLYVPSGLLASDDLTVKTSPTLGVNLEPPTPQSPSTQAVNLVPPIPQSAHVPPSFTFFAHLYRVWFFSLALSNISSLQISSVCLCHCPP